MKEATHEDLAELDRKIKQLAIDTGYLILGMELLPLSPERTVKLQQLKAKHEATWGKIL